MRSQQLLAPALERPPRGPFSGRDEGAFRRWRDAKLAARPARAADLLVEVRDPRALSPAERTALLDRLRRANLAVYACPATPQLDSAGVLALARQLGLLGLDRNLCAEEDGVAAIRVVEGGRSGEYIPYSARAIGWHTDGYYNPTAEQVRGLVMHCVRQAPHGGANRLLDPELVYLRLREAHPDVVEALMRADAMTVPANHEHGVEIRPARTGPVFSVTPGDGALHLRYTHRTRSVRWLDDSAVRAAAERLRALLDGPLPDAYEVRLAPGQGVVCNNVLHTREAFEDGTAPEQRRLLLRARYRERVAGT